MKRSILRSLLLFSLISVVINVFPQVSKRIYYADENLFPEAHPMDFTHLKLEVSFEPTVPKVIGKVTHDFTVLSSEVDTLFLHGI